MQQQGGSPYGVPPPPDMSNLFSSPPLSDAAAQQQQQQQMVSSAAAAESASPISTRPPPPQPQYSAAVPNYEELGVADDSLCPEEGPGGAGGLSGSGGNRWPRQETLALLKIRSDMDAIFRDATLKGPLWEEVSRKLGELGYRRSAKKCKEKFENVHKYYKRTKEGRAGRQDGKSYRFFSQLEALHSTTAAAANSVFMDAAMNTSSAAPAQPVATAAAAAAAAAARFPNPQQVSAPTPIATAPPPHLPPMPMPMLVHENPGIGAAATAAGLSFSSNSSSDASETDGDEEDDDEATEEGPSIGKKRKREVSGGGERKMMAFFEGMMRQVMERQEAMQQRFLEVIEKREQDRAIREEAWRRQEMARIDREHEVAAGERAAAAARDAAVISFLQKVTGQTLPVPQQTTTTSAALPPAPIPIPAPPPPPAPTPATLSIVQTPPLPPTQPQPQPQQQLTPPPSQRQPQPPPPSPQQQNTEMLHQQYHQTQQQTPSLVLPPPPPPMCPTSSELVPISSEQPQDGGATVSVSLDPSSSRWPKTEVHALINLRSGLDSRYQESGPKGPLWEEISAGMKRLGYNRSAKRCKEKWENINKYFKKVKEGNKKRPEDAKTCPYFHQLDALYRSKLLTGVPGSFQGPQEQDSTHRNLTNPQPISVVPPASQQQQLNQGQMDTKKGNGGATDAGAGGPSNCRMPATLSGGNGDNNNASGIMKKPEDIVKELMSQPNDDDYGRGDEPDSDNMDEDDEEDDEEEDEDGGKSQYTIQFQRPNVGGGNGTGSTSAATAPRSGGKAPGSSFLAMVR